MENRDRCHTIRLPLKRQVRFDVLNYVLEYD